MGKDVEDLAGVNCNMDFMTFVIGILKIKHTEVAVNGRIKPWN